ARLADALRAPRGEVLLAQDDRTLGRLEHAADGEHQAGLAGAVGAEQRGDLSGRDLQRDLTHNGPPAALDGDLVEPQDVVGLDVGRGGSSSGVGHAATSSAPRYACLTWSLRSTSAVSP